MTRRDQCESKVAPMVRQGTLIEGVEGLRVMGNLFRVRVV